MLKRIIRQLSKEPIIYNFLRRIIEFNFIKLKQTIKKEFSLNDLTFGDKKILDVPCGTGEFCRLFNPKGYIGIDISSEYINYARKTYQHTFYCRDARQNGFKDAYFDQVLILGLLHHLDISDIISALKETRRVLKNDGKVILIEDAPVSSNWNLVGKFLQKLDVGGYLRPAKEYRSILEEYFYIDKCYPIRNGFWDYSIFVLSPK